jgi:pectate lyase
MVNVSRRITNVATIIRKVKLFWFGLAVIGLSLGVSAVGLIAFATPAGAAPADPLVGYGVGTTGGAGGSTVTVSSLAALKTAVSGSTARIVRISGTINGAGDILVGSNKTILGIGSSSVLGGLGLDMKGVKNVIIRNMTIHNVKASSGTGDAIHIENSTHLWIDHNNLYSDRNHGKDYYDGLLDITHAGDYITVSWNRLHDHYKVSLVGHSDSNGAQDTGHLHVTYAHNWFYNDGSRLPSLRFGTAQIYNNYYENVTLDAIHSRENAQMLVQNNVFRNVGTALTTTGDSKVDGFANASGNDWGGSKVDITKTGSFAGGPPAPYKATPDATSSVISEVTAYSGVGIVG